MTQRGFGFFTSLLVSVLLMSCAHRGPSTKEATTTSRIPSSNGMIADIDSEEAVEVKLSEKEASSEDVEENAVKPYRPSYGEIAMDDHQLVRRWLDYFQGRGRERMTTYLERSGRYLPMMKNVLRENGLPEELVYIALIESGFSPRAHSRANAVGYWQFIRETGRRYGLKVDAFIDERRDPVLSTKAAVEYFKTLYSLFGSWHLAMASYNSGEGRIKRAVMKHKTRSFWALADKRRALPIETKNYVPKFIAASMIASDPAKYGFAEIKFQDPLSYDTVVLTNPISLTKLASNVGVNPEELKLLNPKFRSDYVPMARNGQTVVRLPVGLGDDATAALSMSATSQPKVANNDYIFYKIKKGDSLSTIARKHRTTVSKVRRLNDLSNRYVLRVGSRLRIPDKGGSLPENSIEEDANIPSSTKVVEVAYRETSSNVAAGVVSASTEYHVVRRGDNLSNIAQKYSLSIADLLKLNNLTNRSILRPGQKIKVRGDSVDRSVKGMKSSVKKKNVVATKKTTKKVSAKVAQKKPANASKIVHKVRRGETLDAIARKYKISMPKLVKANSLPRSGRLLAGAQLVIPQR